MDSEILVPIKFNRAYMTFVHFRELRIIIKILLCVRKHTLFKRHI